MTLRRKETYCLKMSTALVERAGTRDRLAGGMLRCFARFGVAKTTIDDIAREAGCSRATLYRAFPGGKDELVAAVVGGEVRRFFDEIARRLEGLVDLEDLLVVAMATAVEQIEAHEALAFLVAHEPELVWPHVAFSELNQVLARAAAFFEPYLVERLGLEDARRVGEWVARIVLSHVVCPPGDGGPGAGRRSLDEAAARRLVRSFVMPGVRQLESADILSPI